MVLVLFMLPQSVVKKDSGPSPAEESSHADPRGGNTEAAEESFPAAVLSKTDSAKANESVKVFSDAASPKEKRLVKADSLSVLYRRAGNYRNAARWRDSVYSISPDSRNAVKAGEAWFEAAAQLPNDEKGIAFRKAFTGKARERFTKAMSDPAFKSDAKIKLALTWVDSEDPMKGISLLREVITEEPENKSAILQLGLLSMRSGQFDKAEARFKKLLELDPANDEARWQLALSLNQGGKRAEAIATLKPLLKSRNDEIKSSAESMLKELEGTGR